MWKFCWSNRCIFVQLLFLVSKYPKNVTINNSQIKPFHCERGFWRKFQSSLKKHAENLCYSMSNPKFLVRFISSIPPRNKLFQLFHLICVKIRDFFLIYFFNFRCKPLNFHVSSIFKILFSITFLCKKGAVSLFLKQKNYSTDFMLFEQMCTCYIDIYNIFEVYRYNVIEQMKLIIVFCYLLYHFF